LSKKVVQKSCPKKLAKKVPKKVGQKSGPKTLSKKVVQKVVQKVLKIYTNFLPSKFVRKNSRKIIEKMTKIVNLAKKTMLKTADHKSCNPNSGKFSPDHFVYFLRYFLRK